MMKILKIEEPATSDRANTKLECGFNLLRDSFTTSLENSNDHTVTVTYKFDTIEERNRKYEEFKKLLEKQNKLDNIASLEKQIADLQKQLKETK